jgi:hypothetical protein
MIDHLALARAIDEAWLLMAVLTALAVLSLPFAGARASLLRPSGERDPEGVEEVSAGEISPEKPPSTPPRARGSPALPREGEERP